MAYSFAKNCIILTNSVKLVSKNNNFKLNSSYGLVTFHVLDKNIKKILIKIILNQIHSNISPINNLFFIKCPIAKQTINEDLKKSFIKDWLLQRHQNTISIEKLNQDLKDIGVSTNEKITTNDQLRKYIENLDFDKINDFLNFEIKIHKPNEYTSNLALDFKPSKSVDINLGLFELDNFKDFDIDKTVKSDIKSIVEFDSSKTYSFSLSENVNKTNESFFDIIKEKINSSLIIVLPCCDNDEDTKLITSYSKKYIINYN
jgi:hypothetical protein